MPSASRYFEAMCDAAEKGGMEELRDESILRGEERSGVCARSPRPQLGGVGVVGWGAV
jgi:hypothetical protein